LAHHIPKLRSNFAEFLRYCYSNVLACDASPSVVNFSTVLPELRFLALRGSIVGAFEIAPGYSRKVTKRDPFHLPM